MMDVGEMPNTTEKVDVAKQIEFRFKQSDDSQLAEYITGMTPDNPKMLDRVIKDHEEIRKEYGLPDLNFVFDYPERYEIFLKDVLAFYGKKVIPRSECGDYFEKHLATAVHLDSGDIGLDIDRENSENYVKCIRRLEHETIHVIQDKLHPEMTAEMKEYQAYIAGQSMRVFIEKPEMIKAFFGNFLYTSIYGDVYGPEREGKKPEDQRWETPMWRNPEYFLKNVDGIGEAEIEKYKAEKALVEANKE